LNIKIDGIPDPDNIKHFRSQKTQKPHIQRPKTPYTTNQIKSIAKSPNVKLPLKKKTPNLVNKNLVLCHTMVNRAKSVLNNRFDSNTQNYPLNKKIKQSKDKQKKGENKLYALAKEEFITTSNIESKKDRIEITNLIYSMKNKLSKD